MLSLDNDEGPVSTSSFVGTNEGKLDWAIKATGALGTEGVAGFRGIEGDTWGVSLRCPNHIPWV